MYVFCILNDIRKNANDIHFSCHCEPQAWQSPISVVGIANATKQFPFCNRRLPRFLTKSRNDRKMRTIEILFYSFRTK